MENSTHDNIDSVFKSSKDFHYKKGEILIRCDEDIPRAIYFLKTGYVKMNTILPDGREIILNIFKPDSFFPLAWLMADRTNKYNYQAMTPVIVLRQPKDLIIKFLKNNPTSLFSINKRVMIGTESLITKIEHLLCGSSFERIVYALFILAKQFGDIQKDRTIKIKLPITHQDIANLVAVSRETASIALEKLKFQKVINYKRARLQINNMGHLDKLISQSADFSIDADTSI
jgi:CRP/FNR family transcriptional regulator, cyclic AMP receptor protein